MNNIYWSDAIKNAAPYVPGEQPKDKKFIKLNTNENPYPPSPKVLEAIKASVCADLRLYPDPDASGIRKAASEYYGISDKQIFPGNGSDEVLALAFLSFFSSRKKIMFPDITYSFYPVYADIFNIAYETVPLDEDFSIPIEKFFVENGGTVISNPNAPTGMYLPIDSIKKILQNNSKSVVIVDEAYIDFGGESAVNLINEFSNLLVVQTLSKSRQLAGLRIGLAIGNEGLIEGLDTAKNSINSYTIDRLALNGGCAALKDKEYFEITRKKIIDTRNRISLQLCKLGFRVLDSKANFIFVSHSKYRAVQLYSSLKQNGILVRYFNKPRIDNFLRISIGTDEEMDTLVKTLSQIIKN